MSTAAGLAPGDSPQVVPSPCNSVCRMDPATGWCEGCLRTIDEIIDWSALDDAGKLAVWDNLASRRAQRESAVASVPARSSEAG